MIGPLLIGPVTRPLLIRYPLNGPLLICVTVRAASPHMAVRLRLVTSIEYQPITRPPHAQALTLCDSPSLLCPLQAFWGVGKKPEAAQKAKATKSGKPEAAQKARPLSTSCDEVSRGGLRLSQPPVPSRVVPHLSQPPVPSSAAPLSNLLCRGGPRSLRPVTLGRATSPLIDPTSKPPTAL